MRKNKQKSIILSPSELPSLSESYDTTLSIPAGKFPSFSDLYDYLKCLDPVIQIKTYWDEDLVKNE
jgi:hypothetical protein